VTAKAAVHQLIDDLALHGKAVLLVSDDLAELRHVCDRIAVMHRGVLGAARPATEWTDASLLAAATLPAAGRARAATGSREAAS
jgi:ABC-type sugar transport system ATPase subunit